MRRCLLVAAGIITALIFTVYMLGAKSCAPEDLAGLWRSLTWADNQGQTRAAEQGDPVRTNRREELLAARAGMILTASGSWQLIWADEFEQAELDSDCWTALERKDNYNNELQYFLPENAVLADGCLSLVAKKQRVANKYYTSAMVQTLGKLSFQQGRIEARIRLPVGKGLLPAFWLLSNRGKNEIDIMEMVGSEPGVIYGVVHQFVDVDHFNECGSLLIESPEEFHLYAVEREEKEIRWYVDNELYHHSQLALADEMYIIFTLAVGGNWPGLPGKNTLFPCSMSIDYLRLYVRPNTNEGCHHASFD